MPLSGSRSPRVDRKLCAWLAPLLLVLATHGICHAQRAPDIEVPEGRPCLSAAALDAHIQSWLGGTRVDPALRVFADESADGLQARFQVRQGTRVVANRLFAPAPPDCAQRQAVMGLAIALVLKGSLFEELSLSAEQVRRSPAHLLLGVQALVTIGVLPEPAGGGALAFSWAREGWLGVRVRLEATGHPSLSLRGVQGEFGAALYALGVDGCAHTPQAARLTGAVCLGLAAGLWTVRGHGFERSYVGRDAWAAGVGSLLGDLRLTPQLALQARLSLQVLLTPIEVEARDTAGELLARRALGTAGAAIALGPAYVFR